MTETNGNKESCENLCNNLVVRKRKMLKDERGQLSIDFLVGISLFILALLFMAHFIPGMFVPFQSETIDLNSVAYRTSVILVEDPGWWDGGEDWENHIENVRRVGLAIDKEHPNKLNMSKTKGFKNATQINDTYLTHKLGLYRIVGDNEIDYGYNITIEDLNGNILDTRGEIPPEYGDVVKMKRIVWMHTSSEKFMLGQSLEGASSPTKALFYINKSDVKVLEDGIGIFITNFDFTAKPEKTYEGIKLANDVGPPKGPGFQIKGGNTFTDTGGYVSLLSGTTGDFSHYQDGIFANTKWDINNGNDTLEIFLAKSVFVNQSIETTGTKDIYVELQFGPGINVTGDYDLPAGTPFVPLAVPAYELTELTIQVWT